MITDCVNSWDLILQLFKRDYLMMHKKSFIGMGWHIAAPIMGIVSWVLMNSTGILTPGDVGIPYPAYVMLSTSIWSFFMSSYTNASQVLAIAGSFIHQVGFEHHVLIAKQWMQTYVNFVIAFVVIVIAMSTMGVFPHPLVVLYPLALIPILLLGSAVGLVVAVIQVVAPDVKRVATFVMGLWMFFTPVIYSPKVKNALLLQVIEWNPMTYLLGGARSLFIFGRIENPIPYGISVLLTVAGFLIISRVFFISEEKVIEKMI